MVFERKKGRKEEGKEGRKERRWEESKCKKGRKGAGEGRKEEMLHKALYAWLPPMLLASSLPVSQHFT